MSSSSTSTFITITKPSGGWPTTISYELGGSYPLLTLDGVQFELRDLAACQIAWDLLGMDVTVVSSISYESTEPIDGALLAVAGRVVEIRDGSLWWGDEDLGPVHEGDRVLIVDGGISRQA